jgi:DNA (cytosine-5)-methyltransferase 1
MDKLLRHVDLCSGIGGFALGFEWAGLSRPVMFCDIEEWSRQIVSKHWPDVPVATDVKELADDPDGLIPDCDILTAGYPCQPFSVAGQRRGTEDDRHIWPYILSIVKTKRPAWCVFENVYGHVSMGLDEVLSDLEGQGYAARPFIVPACAADAPHRRDRIWIIGRNVGDTQHNGSPSAAIKRSSQEASDNKSEGQSEASQSARASQSRDSASMEGSTRADNVGDTDSKQRRATKKDRGLDMDRAVLDQRQGREEADAPERSGGNVANSNSAGLQGRENARSTSQSRAQRDEQSARRSERADGQNWLPEPAVGRVANGIPRRVDRLRGLGNAIVPQIAMRIGQTIKAAHDIPAQGHAHNNVNNQTK